MAVIKVTNSKGKVGNVINYITKLEKTEEKLISGKDCNPLTAKEEMEITKGLYNKKDGRQYVHFIQSFNPGDNVDPKQAHEIGRKWAEKNFKGHEVLIATHIDKGHIHSHFVVNSVNFENGKKFQQSRKDLQKLKEHSNELSREHGLSVPTKGKEITMFNQGKYRLFKRIEQGENIRSYVLDTAIAVEKATGKAKDRSEFISNMEKQGYKVSWEENRKHVTFQDKDKKKVRLANLEKTFKESKFSKEGLENEFSKFEKQSRGKQQSRGSKSTDHTSDVRIAPNVDWSAVEHNVQGEGNRVSKQPGDAITGAIQQQIREIKERTDRATESTEQRDSRIEADRGELTESKPPVEPKPRRRSWEMER